MSSTESIAFNTLPEFILEEVQQKDMIKQLNLIGKGMTFNNDELEKIGNRFEKKITEKDIMRVFINGCMIKNNNSELKWELMEQII